MSWDLPDSPKMTRETLCVAQAYVGTAEHRNRLQRLIDLCDVHRPLGPDGKHGNRHTPTCGCENREGQLSRYERAREVLGDQIARYSERIAAAEKEGHHSHANSLRRDRLRLVRQKQSLAPTDFIEDEAAPAVCSGHSRVKCDKPPKPNQPRCQSCDDEFNRCYCGCYCRTHSSDNCPC